jgi:hypothetical protein
MATQSNRREFPSFFADTKSAETLRRQFIEAPLEAAGQSALGSGIELGNLFSMLPAAFVASQERELKRVLSSGIENDPRVAALESSIEQAGVLQMMAQRGQVRIERALVAVANKDHVFHGFVSDADLAPLKGLTVRLTGSKATRSKTLSTTTDDDGYFSIALGTKSNMQDSGAKASKISLAQRISDLMAGPGIEPISTPLESVPNEDASQVEILKKGKLAHSDPVLVARDQGSVYREYVISTEKPPSASDFRKFMSASKPRSKPTDVSSSERITKRSANAGSAKGKPKK